MQSKSRSLTADLLRKQGDQGRQIEEIETREGVVPVAGYTSNAAPSIPSGTATVVNFEDLGYDPLSLVTTGAGWKFTAAVGGYYLVSCLVTLSASAAWAVGESFIVSLFVNTTETARLYNTNNLASGAAAGGGGSIVVHLNAGDYVQIKVYQGSGSSIAMINSGLLNWISIAKVG